MSERLALCITREYSTFRSLWDAYRKCTTDKQREALLKVGRTSISKAGDGGLCAAVAPFVSCGSVVVCCAQDLIVSPPPAQAKRLGSALSKAVYQSVWQQQQSPTAGAAAAAAADDMQRDDEDPSMD